MKFLSVFEYNFLKTNQCYDYLSSENSEVSGKVPVESIWDLNTPLPRKDKKEYFVDFRIPWVKQPFRNFYENPGNFPVNQAVVEQGRNLDAWKKQRMLNNEEAFYDHILDLFPFRAPRKKSSSSNQERMILPRKRFYPMSMSVVNTLNARNKQLLMNDNELINDPEFQFLLYHLLLLSSRKKPKDDREWTKLIRKRNALFIPVYVGKLFHRKDSASSNKNVST